MQHTDFESFYPAVGEKGLDSFSQNLRLNRMDRCHSLAILNGQSRNGGDTVAIVRGKGFEVRSDPCSPRGIEPGYTENHRPR
jgi:hypothetical protein